jgi:pimeloyl-ACP methyl ester carboxylesterase
MTTWAEEVRAVAGARISRDTAGSPVLVGHSLGGAIAWLAAQRTPEAFASLILVDSYIKVGVRLPRQQGEPVPLRRYPSREAILARFRTLPPQPVLLDYVVDHIAESSIIQHRDGWTWKHDPGVSAPAPQTLPPPADPLCPTTVIRAEFGIVRPALVDELRTMLGDAFAHVDIPGAGHHIMLDQPCALSSAVHDAIAADRLSTGPSRCGT